MFRASIIHIFLFLSILIAGCSDDNKLDNKFRQNNEIAVPSTKRVLRFGLYATDNPSEHLKRYTPLLQYIQEQLNLTGKNIVVKFQGYSNYAMVIEAISSGKCDFSRTGPASYILAKQRNPNIRLIAMEHINNKTTFKGMIITHIDSPIQTLDDLRGATFAFGDRNSTIGRYLSQAELVRAGIYTNDLKSYDYLGRHDLIAKSVIRRQYDTGAIKESTFHKYKTELRVIHEFTNITKPWIASAELENELFLKLQHILITIDDASLMEILRKTGFRLSIDADYDFVRSGMKLSEKFLDITKTEE